MNMQQLVEWKLTEETEVLRENLSQCHPFHHKSHMTWPGIEPGYRGGKPANKHLSYGTTFHMLQLPPPLILR
jgi:hypothetical protein